MIYKKCERHLADRRQLDGFRSGLLAAVDASADRTGQLGSGGDYGPAHMPQELLL